MKNQAHRNWRGILRQGLILTIYMAVWFCAFIFYDKEALNIQDASTVSYGFAILKALLLSKFMLVAEIVIPITLKPGKSLYRLIAVRTFFDAVVVLIFSYVFAGIEGLHRHQGFIDSMRSFCHGDVERISALFLMYWFLMLPYVAYRVLGKAMGQENLQSYLDGKMIAVKNND